MPQLPERIYLMVGCTDTPSTAEVMQQDGRYYVRAAFTAPWREVSLPLASPARALTVWERDATGIMRERLVAETPATPGRPLESRDLTRAQLASLRLLHYAALPDDIFVVEYEDRETTHWTIWSGGLFNKIMSRPCGPRPER